jgi:hypothetical protein
MSKIRDIKNGLDAMKTLRELQSWYERGYVASVPGRAAVPPDYQRATPDQRIAYQAGRADAAAGRPMKGMLD